MALLRRELCRQSRGFLASWRPLYSSTGAVKVIGSPFDTSPTPREPATQCLEHWRRRPKTYLYSARRRALMRREAGNSFLISLRSEPADLARDAERQACSRRRARRGAKGAGHDFQMQSDFGTGYRRTIH